MQKHVALFERRAKTLEQTIRQRFNQAERRMDAAITDSNVKAVAALMHADLWGRLRWLFTGRV